MKHLNFILFSLSAISTCGCCFERKDLTDERVTGWVATIQVGSSGRDAYKLLESKGLAPYYSGDHIHGRAITSSCIGMQTWIDISVSLDNEGRVVRSEVLGGGQNFP